MVKVGNWEPSQYFFEERGKSKISILKKFRIPELIDIYNDSDTTAQTTHHLNTYTSRLLLIIEIVAVYCENN
jgi:hypothetical protein